MRTLLAALVGVLLAGDLLHAQRSPYKDWARLQLEALGGGDDLRPQRRRNARTSPGRVRMGHDDRIDDEAAAAHAACKPRRMPPCRLMATSACSGT